MHEIMLSPLAEESIRALSTTRKAEVVSLLKRLQLNGVEKLGHFKVSAASENGYIIRTRSDVRITILPMEKGTYLVDDVFTKASLPPGAAAKSAFAKPATLDRSIVAVREKKFAAKKGAA